MAKPGSAEAARLAAMARAAADLGGGALSGEMQYKGRVAAESQLGMRCGGCGERIGVGLQFTRIDVVLRDGKPAVDVARLSSCNGADGCDYADKARVDADVIEMVEFVWVHGDKPVGSGLSLDDAVQAAEDAVRPRAAEDRANGVAPG